MPEFSPALPAPNGNGHHAVDLASALDDSVLADYYEPKGRDVKYLHALYKILSDAGRVTNATLAAALDPPSTATAVQKWRERHPAAEAWVRREIARSVELDKPLVLRRATELALRGSVDHMNFLAKVGGWFAQPETHGGVNVTGIGNFQIVMGVPLTPPPDQEAAA